MRFAILIVTVVLLATTVAGAQGPAADPAKTASSSQAALKPAEPAWSPAALLTARLFKSEEQRLSAQFDLLQMQKAAFMADVERAFPGYTVDWLTDPPQLAKKPAPPKADTKTEVKDQGKK